ncbi:hypothetical protein MUK42_03493 [Musa troglodytarum]|uniref:Uncharacterized protein n=1 Tax=Musa troglodytarum TaxID=320322 RepID=A0A9E7GUW2_9LILI|nr:hypothetical protein MUK42_03493 [Musa troglodytarum]
MGDCDEFMWRAMLYIMVIILQFSFTIKYILSKALLGSGMSQCVLVYLLIHHEQHLAGHDLHGCRAYRKVDLKMIYRDIREGGRDSGHRCRRHVDSNLQRTSNGAGLKQACRFSWIQLTGRHRVEQQQLVYGLLLPHLVHLSFGFSVSPLGIRIKIESIKF